MHTSRARAYTALAVVCIVWGTTYLAIRIALETIPPFMLTAIRYVAAGTLLTATLAVRGEPLPGPRDWGSLVILGVLLLAFGNGGVVWAEQTVPSGLTSVLVATTPFWMTGIDAVAPHGEPLTARRVAGLTVGFAGIVALVWPELRMAGGGRFLAGVVAAQIACAGWAVGSIYARSRSRSENVLVTAAFEMLFGGLVMLAAASLHGEWARLSFTARSMGGLAYLIVFGSLVAFTAYAYALKHLPVATVTIYAYVNPVIAVLLGTLVMGEPLSPRIAVAAALVLVGTAIVRRP